MTLKTTKEQRDALLIKLDDPDFAVYNTVTLYNSVVRDFCHDAGRAEELEEEAKEHEAKLKEQQAASNNLNERLGNCKQSAKEGWRYAYELEQERKKLNEENADLRAKLNGAQKDAERYRIIRYMGPMPFWMDYGGSVHDADGCDGAADRALKEQEKV